jgi:hypothetical protein
VAQSFADDEGASVYTQLVEISAKLDELSERFEQLEADYQQQNATMQDGKSDTRMSDVHFVGLVSTVSRTSTFAAVGIR